MVSLLCLCTELFFLHSINIINSGIINDGAVHVLIIVQSAAIVYDFYHSKVLQAYKLQLLAGYFWRLFLLYFDIYGRSIYPLPNSGADSDSFYYGAVFVANGRETGRTMLPVVMGYIYRYTGVTRIYGQYLLMLCSVVSLCALALILNMLNIDSAVKVRTIGVTALLPNFAILSSIYLRESIVTMFVSLSLLMFVRWVSTKMEIYFLVAFIFALAGAVFHSGVVSMALGYFVVRIIYDKYRNRFHISLANLLFVFALAFFFVYLYLNYESLLFGKFLNLEDISDIANINERGGSSYAAYVGDSSSLLNLVRYTLPRMFYFSFSPFPWQWRGISDIIAFMFSSVFYISAVYSSVKSVLRQGNNRAIIIFLLCIFASLDFVFGWGTSNVGTAARHRDKMVILFATLWALGHDGSRIRSMTFDGYTLL